MRVVVDIPPELVDDIRSVVQRGAYASPEEFLDQALRTQLELESGEQGTLLSFGDAIRSEQGQPHTETGQAEPTTKGAEEGPHLEDLSARHFDVNTVEPPATERTDTGPLWGQYNRIFPMKLSVRRLAIFLNDTESDSAPYKQFREQTARVAREYGLRLEDVDEEKGRGRGERFSAALPTGDKVERSLARYQTHFVGQIDTNGQLTGSLPNLQFVDIDPETRDFGLTQAGLEFALIENPLLDEAITAEEPLSDAEREFYLGHVESEHSAEYDAMQIVATAITDGVDRPDPLSERVGELSDDWSSAQASTIRSGLIGRMHELGLVSRHRVGARGIGYQLTELGERELQ